MNKERETTDQNGHDSTGDKTKPNTTDTNRVHYKQNPVRADKQTNNMFQINHYNYKNEVHDNTSKTRPRTGSNGFILNRVPHMLQAGTGRQTCLNYIVKPTSKQIIKTN